MVELAHRYGPKAFGFNWLGDELQGRAIPADWWSAQSQTKKLERSIDDDPVMKTPAKTAINERMDEIRGAQEVILDKATAASLNDGRYDALSVTYYTNLANLTHGTPYAALAAFYSERDHRIAANILAKVTRLPMSRIAIACGADHHGPIIAALRKAGLSSEIQPVRDF